MRNTVNCKIDEIGNNLEKAVFISIPDNRVLDLIALLSALLFRKIKEIIFQDEQERFVLTANDNNTRIHMAESHSISFHGYSFPVSNVQLECIQSLLLDVAIHGWSDSSHIDVELNNGINSLTVCICIDISEDSP